MPAPVVTWRHALGYSFEDGDGVASASIEVPSGMKWFGGWAESCNQYGPDPEAPTHYACTPANFGWDHNYGMGAHPIVGITHSYDSNTDTTYIEFHFKCDPGQQIRAHLFTVA